MLLSQEVQALASKASMGTIGLCCCPIRLLLASQDTLLDTMPEAEALTAL